MKSETPIKNFFSRTPTIILLIFVVIFALDVFDILFEDNARELRYMFIPLLPLIFYWLYYKQKMEIEAFSKWLTKNIHSFNSQEAIMYNEKQITKDTELVEYEMVISVLFLFTFVFPSGKMLPEYHNTTFFRILFGFISLICGWWCIPWGVMATPAALYWNIKGGKRYTLQSMSTEEGQKQIQSKIKSRFVFFF